MNRSQLINELATKTNLNKRDITTISVHSNHVCKQAVRQETPETGM